MNDVFNNVMTFINKNTYLLIGICVFLILVLIVLVDYYPKLLTFLVLFHQ